MRTSLTALIIVGSVVAAVVTEFLVYGAVQPPDAMSAFLGGVWLAAPYLLAIVLALLFGPRTGPLIVLLVTLVVAASVGLSLFGKAASEQANARTQVKNAVLPGEDPTRGPAAMRKTGAELGADIGWGFMILLAVMVPPVQLGLIVVPSVVAFAIAFASAPRRELEPPEVNE